MLVIRRIQLRGPQVVRPKRLTQVRIGYDDFLCINKKPGKIIQEEAIQWDQDMTMPIIFKKPIEFEFFPVHQFGYSPKQLENIGYARVTILNFKKPSIQAAVKNSSGETIGQLYFSFKIINDRKIVHAKAQPETVLTVYSMLAHFNQYYGQKGYIQIQVDADSTTTPQIDMVAGQLLWVEKLILPLYNYTSKSVNYGQKELIIRIFLQDEIHSQISLKLSQLKQSKNKMKKLPIINKQSGQRQGTLFIEVVLKQKIQKIHKMELNTEIYHQKDKILKNSRSKDSLFLPNVKTRHNTSQSYSSLPKVKKTSSMKKIYNNSDKLDTEQTNISRKNYNRQQSYSNHLRYGYAYQQEVKYQVEKLLQAKLEDKKVYKKY